MRKLLDKLPNMAALKTICNKIHQSIKINQALPSVFQQNGMSQYPSFYIQPVYRKEDQQNLEKQGELQKIVHVPTRAALVDQTCSPSQDPVINLFINYTMRHGRKMLARNLVEKAFENIKRMQLEKYHKAKTEEGKAKIELDPKVIFHKAVVNSKPVLSLQPIKRGGVKYQVPVPITDKKSQFIAMNWLIQAAKDKHRKIHFPERLAAELIDAANNTGRVVKQKQDLHKQCEANRAYAHYRWS